MRHHGLVDRSRQPPRGPSDEEFGRHVRQQRERLGLSLDEFAARAELSVETVEELEAGLRVPMYPELWALARGLGLGDPGALFRRWERRGGDDESLL